MVSDVEETTIVGDIEGDRLNLVGRNLVEFDRMYGDKYGKFIREIDLNFNCFRRVNNLEKFKNLETILLDNNEIESSCEFPFLPSVHTLWVNNNNISNLTAFIITIQTAFPNLLYLSMMKNPACPQWTTDPEEYRKFRLYVISNFPKLKFLDAAKVTPEEAQQAARIRASPQTAQARPQPIPQTSETESPFSSESASSGRSHLSFGRHYAYSGKGSEGNRFITNEEL